MTQTFDRSAEDLGNSVGLEHLNIMVPDQRLATLFYISGLGFTRDPYLVTGVDNMWMNIGRSQFHLPTGKPQVVRGRAGVVVPDLKALVKRLGAVKERLAETRFGFTAEGDHVDVTCPWGNQIRCHEPDAKRFGSIILGLPYIAFDVEKGKAEGIARFYRQIIGAPATTEKSKGGAAARVTVGQNQHLIFEETSSKLPEYDGHHLQIYIVNFSGPHRQLNDRGLVTEESNQYQYRFNKIVDPDSAEALYTLEHEVRSVTHPLYARPLVNRNAEQTNRDYAPGYDAGHWAMAAAAS
jgi:catechol-2,3-dioxygenase